MDLIALAAAKNYANKVTAGFKNVELDGMNLTFTLLDDTKATVAIPAPADGKDGVSVKDLSIDADGSLLCHMTDGTVIDAGYVPTVDPDLTNYYTKEEIDTNLGNVIIVPIITYSSYGDKLQENLDAIQRILPLIKEKDVILRVVERDNANYEGMQHRLFFLSPAEYNKVTDIATYTGSLTWHSELEHTIRTLDNTFYDTKTVTNLRVNIENGVVISLDGTQGGSSSNQHSTELAILGKYNKKAYTPTEDYHPATKKYVDDAMGSSGLKYLYEVDYDLGNNTPNNFTPVDKTILKNKLTNIINDVYNKGQETFSLFLYARTSTTNEVKGGLFTPQVRADKKLLTKPAYCDLYTHVQNGSSGNTLDGNFSMTQLSIYLSWDENNVATVTDVSFQIRNFASVSSNNVLTKNGTTQWTPTGDYQPATKKYVDDSVAAIRTPKSHDGEGMIGWYGTAVAGDNLTELYGVTPDMVRAVKAGDYISWPSRVQTRATENTICLYNMTYEVYNKDEGDYLETIDIKIGKSPSETYTYVIVGDNVYKETF